ncbi:outer membrane beta-barrel protein [Terricaulis sp.]|uniref:outer membrane beta-barrel protein n=1 Tax=Terricaulis sp. TaxID=2768686 RepID=UPI003783A616
MNKLAISLAALATATFGLPSVAHADWYAGAGYTQYDPDGADETGGVTGRLGYRMNPNFAVEGEGTLGTDEGSNSELNSAVGAYAVGILPIGSSGFEVHGRAGYNHLDIDRDAAPDLNSGGFSYGAGVGWQATQRIGIRADWTRTDTDDGDADGISLGGTFNF